MAIIENIVSKFVVLQCPGIEKAVVREEQRNGKTFKILQVQGVNMSVSVNLNYLKFNKIKKSKL